ncbi:hypothetical protein [Carboxylicivirga sp. RSCT41]|uniref:hypothetical protein n=1 Tax=Carboxylicivirga agarovorans TaxID=3417570 RepID=UPI003D32EBCD
MLQFAILSIILSAFILVHMWKWGISDTSKKQYKKPSKEVFSFKNGAFKYEEQEL